MSKKRDAVVRRLKKLVSDAKTAGVHLVADSDAMGVRVLTAEEYRDARDDLRRAGELVDFDDACGGSTSRVGGLACNMTDK